MIKLDNIHGQNTAIVVNKFHDFLIARSPSKNKGLYDGFVVVPAMLLSNVLRCLIEPIELIASCAIHLIAAAFSGNHKDELIKARDFLLIEFPIRTLWNIFIIAFAPIHFLVNEATVIQDPVKFEEQCKRTAPKENIQKLNILIEDIDDENDKILAKLILEKIYCDMPWSIKDYLSLFRLFLIYDADINKGREEFKRSWENHIPNLGAEEEPIIKDHKLRSFATIVYERSLHYNIPIPKKSFEVLKNKQASEEEIKNAVDAIRKRLLLVLHPDKTEEFTPDERVRRNQEYTKINNAWDLL